MSEQVFYRKTQVGWLVIISLAAGLGLALFVAMDAPGEALYVTYGVSGVLVLALLIFATLTVEVGHEELRAWFGPGLFTKRIRIDEIVSYEAVRNKWYYGWGIRLTPGGWMYNVSGLDAVQINTEAKGFRIGTDDPTGLVQAVKQAETMSK